MLDERSILREEKRFIKALQSKDPKAYSIFYKHYAGALNGIISNAIEDKSLCEKVFADLLSDIWADISTYEDKNQRLFSWMVKKVRLRVRSVNIKLKLNTIHKTDNSSTHVHNIRKSKVEINVSESEDSINKREMKIFNLIYFKGLTAQKVAETESMSIEAVRGILRKVIARKRNTFKI